VFLVFTRSSRYCYSTS